jgi:hypothetical protein
VSDDVQARRAALSQALTRIELRETALLSWGAIDAFFTQPEIVLLIGDGLPEGMRPIDVLNEMLEALLVVQTPEGGFRSRMAETMRLLATLRQSFPNRPWWEGPPLVLDQRFLHRPRSRPKRDLPARDFLSRLAAIVTPAAYRVAEKLVPPELSGFQERAAAEILAALRSRADRGVMVAAGTGSGKSLAFYLPALCMIGESLVDDPAHSVRSLAIYPRNELLKDQFSSLLGQVRVLQQAHATERPIVIGTWFGATPYSAQFVSQGRADDWAEVREGGRLAGWRCPFLDCPSCGGAMIWPAACARDGRERLTCTSDHCGMTFDENVINLTRDRASRRPADILLTTTESLNRQLAAPDRHLAFGIGGPRARRIRLVLLDEVHIYEGTTGAQNALLLRRLRHVVDRPLTWVGLSATLVNADRFLEQFAGLDEGLVSVARPEPAELQESGAEYLVALRHDPVWRTGPLSTTIQTAMLVPRCLDRDPGGAPYAALPSSGGFFGSRTFAFTDKLDVTNRLYWNLLSAEGWRTPTRALARSPLTLAHLRAEDQVRRPAAEQESARDRESTGQWWWLPEQLGWDLVADTQLDIGRTSSQDTGVSDRADIIVATATLEVGYDDDRVGAVLQHKAPHDAAQFLQRRGRAGRDPAMRPWTVVVLSGWGRDRRAWQLYEDLFDPELHGRSLPLGNRYILRMQASYALMDWLGGQLSRIGRGKSVWTDLVAPVVLTERSEEAREERRRRQLAAADLLDEVLDGGLARERLRTYLRKALRLGRDDDQAAQSVLDALFWEPPRSLLLTVIPTIVRRLRSDWEGEWPRADDVQVQMRTPLREFVAGNLFDDLMVPDVQVLLPPRVRGDAPDVEHLPALRSIRELMPGNVTRHFGVQSWNRRHWLAAPQPLAQEPVQDVDVTRAYGAILAARFADSHDPRREIYMYRPLRAVLDSPSETGRNAVRDATTSSPRWGVQLQPLGRGRPLNLSRSRWRNIVTDLSFHTHGTGDGVRIRRFATGATGSLFTGADPIPFEISFTAPDAAPSATVALGVEMDVDGLCLVVTLPAEFPQPSRQERCDRQRWLLTDNPDLPAGLSWFDRAPLVPALQLALADLRRADPGPALAGLSDDDLADRLIDALERVNVVRAQDGQQPSNTPALLDWVADDSVLRTVRAAAMLTGADRDGAWQGWLRTRFVATVGAMFVDALSTTCPEVDSSQLALDIEPNATSDPACAEVWLTELAPGGTGQIERLQAALAAQPGRFARILEASAVPGDIEELDQSLRNFIEMASDDGPVGEAAARLRASWSAGHEAANSALAHLRAATAARGLELSRLAWTAISTRVLGAGAHPGLPAALTSWLRTWDEAEARVRVTLDPQVAGVLVAESEDVSAVLNLPRDAPDQRRSRAVANLLWPRGNAAWQDSAEAATTFGPFPDPDIELVRAVLGPTSPPLTVTDWNDDVRRLVHQVLLRESRAVLQFPVVHALDARRAILNSQTDPIDVGSLLGYANVVSVHQRAGHLDVTFVLSEVEA